MKAPIENFAPEAFEAERFVALCAPWPHGGQGRLGVKVFWLRQGLWV